MQMARQAPGLPRKCGGMATLATLISLAYSMISPMDLNDAPPCSKDMAIAPAWVLSMDFSIATVLFASDIAIPLEWMGRYRLPADMTSLVKKRTPGICARSFCDFA